jgi:hypothetical protein
MIIQQYLPIALYLILHFSLIQTLTKKCKKNLTISLILCFSAYSSFMYLHYGQQWNEKNVLSLLPTSYILIATLFRYAIFNKFNRRFFKEKKAPYNPTIIFPGVFTIYWDDKNYTPYTIEYLYSFGILILPWFIFMVI